MSGGENRRACPVVAGPVNPLQRAALAMSDLVRLHTFRQGISRAVDIPVEDLERARQELIAEGCLVWPVADQSCRVANQQAA